MVKVIVLLVVECCGILLIRSKAWKHLLQQVSENRISTKRAKGVAASLIRTSGHLWLLLGFVPIAVLVMTFVSVEQLDAPSAELLAVSALGLTVMVRLERDPPLPLGMEGQPGSTWERTDAAALLADQLDPVAVGVADEGDAVALGAAAGAVGGLLRLDALRRPAARGFRRGRRRARAMWL